MVRGFFNNTPIESQRAYIDTGRTMFPAVAVALIDLFKGNPRISDKTAKAMLEPFYAMFPKYISDQAYLTPSERIAMLIKNIRTSELVELLSYVLRQIAVNEFMANPLAYREVFEGLTPETPVDYLRNVTTELPMSALFALAEPLDLTVHLSIVESGKELRKKEVYGSGAAQNAVIALQVQGDQYFPRVYHPSDFAYVGQLAVKTIEPATRTTETVAKALEIVAANNQHCQTQFMQKSKLFLNMVAAGELTKEQLLDLYVEFLPKSTAVESIFVRSQPINKPAKSNAEQQLVEMLCNKLAAGLATNQIDSNTLFGRIESIEHKSAKAFA